MSRNVMPEPTAEDTRLDLRRPIFDPPSAQVPAAILPDLEPEDEDDAATIQLSRLAWPEPPLNLSERPRLVRTDGGVTRATMPTALREPQRSTYWRGLAIAVILAAMISVFVPRPRSLTRAPFETTPPRPVAAAPAPQPAPAMPPPLIITVGTPPSSVTSASAPSKPPVSVTKLPVARVAAPAPRPRPVSRPAVRPRPAPQAPAVRTAAAPKAAAPSSETVVDDGF
jgi:hypothetical protein